MHLSDYSKSFALARASGVLLIAIVATATGVPQSGRPDDPGPKRPAAVTRPQPKPPKPHVPKPSPRATLTVKVSPTDSTVLLDNMESNDRDPATGIVRFTELKVTDHQLVVRHPGFRDHSRPINLEPGNNGPAVIELEPLPGSLNISLTTDGAEISVKDDADRELISQTGSVDNFSLAPGDYEIRISKSGYHSLTRKVTINPAQSIYLEPKLEQIEIEKPRKRQTSVTPVPLSSLIQVEGKYLIVTLRGSSGDSATAGSITVAAGRASSAATEMIGSLNGQSCAIEFIRLENIEDAAIVESPSPSNQWSLIVVRVRPKDGKRLIRFSINWRMLPSASGVSQTGPINAFLEAEPIRRPPPVFPAAARAVRASGTVTVSLAVDEKGDVISARATDGPTVFRQAAEDAARQWKFRPATRNGTPVQSVQTIRFKFEN